METDNYFEAAKALARAKRVQFRIRTDSFGLRELRSIFRHEGIKIDRWPYRLRKVRAAYLVVDGEPSVMLNSKLFPVEPRLFALCHELKHHYMDSDLAIQHPLGCQDFGSYANAPEIEIAAEVFAAELIFPEEEFRTWTERHLKSIPCSATDVVKLKQVCPARVSYTFLTKRLRRLGFTNETFAGVHFKKLEESILGEPFYRRLRR